MKAKASVKSIYEYWKGRGVFETFSKPDTCFACGRGGRVERAHLVPDSFGGSGGPENLVLLCIRCHRDAPNIGVSPEPMIEWINRRESYISWGLRKLMEEFKGIDGFMERAQRIPYPDNFEDLLSEKAKQLKAGFHTHGNFISTLAYICAAIYEDIDLKNNTGQVLTRSGIE